MFVMNLCQRVVEPEYMSALTGDNRSYVKC